MIKFLTCPDIHWSDQWMQTSIEIMDRIKEAAIENSVDFILFPGDLFDKAIYATDKGGINELRQKIRELRKICPLAAIYGTPSHDYKGCYGPLESEGLVILQPGMRYGYSPTAGIIHNNDVNFSGITCLLFGIPEVTKEWYQAAHPDTAADAVNAAAVSLVHDMITGQIAALRSEYAWIPAIAMLHGNVSDAHDKGAEKDIVLKSSDIVLRTEKLAEASIDYWALGHIHTPWQSSKICGGYSGFAGIDKNPWGKRDFVPAMTLVTIEDVKIPQQKRIPYGTPMRVKITEPLDFYDPDIAYWLDTGDQNAEDPARCGGHPWSRLTAAPVKQINRRVDPTLTAGKTLSELGRMYDPQITDRQIGMLKETERVKLAASPDVARDVRVLSTKIMGCDLFNGRTVECDIGNYPTGMYQIVGKNGEGKSSLLGFCTPYPVFVGKSTDSGRPSAIKDFFSGQESGIKKTISMNGEIHEHVITIRGAHTRNPKTECYLSIGGIPQLEKATFDQMMSECEKLYGGLADYIMTSFYVQPLQSPTESGLMTASMTTIRDLVQHVVGVDRSQEKRYALDCVADIEQRTHDETLKIETERGMLSNIDDLQQEIIAKQETILLLSDNVHKFQSHVKRFETEFLAKKLEADTQEENAKRKEELTDKAMQITADIAEHERRVAQFRTSAAAAKAAAEELRLDEITKREFAAAFEAKSAADRENAAASLEYQQIKQEMSEIMAAVEQKKNNARLAYSAEHAKWQQAKAARDADKKGKASLLQRIADIEKPCPECGYIDPTIKQEIVDIRTQIAQIDARIATAEPTEPVEQAPDLAEERKQYAELMRIPEPTPRIIELPYGGMSDTLIAEKKSIVNTATANTAEADTIEKTVLPNLQQQLTTFRQQAEEISVVPVDTSVELAALESAKNNLEVTQNGISKAKQEQETCKKQIATTEVAIKALDKRTEALKNDLEQMSDWKYVSDLLSSKKIPAMELESMLDAIDTAATSCVSPYRDQRYSYRTVTQQEGKTGNTVDKFDVIVHDGETGADKSLLKYSPGEKSFLTDAYDKALTKVRLQRKKTSYDPIIFDESDSFIEIAQISAYYEMQNAHYSDGDQHVFIVSHTPEAGCIQNQIRMEDLKK